MKKYIIPHCETVKVVLTGSCLDDFGLGTQSVGGKPADSLGKENCLVEETENFIPASPNLWDEEDEQAEQIVFSK